MNYVNNKVCAVAGPLCAIGWIVGLLVFAQFLPPPSGNTGPAEIAQFYADNVTGIRTGMILVLFSGICYQPWVCAISVQMKRMEGATSPMTLVQFGLGTLFVLLFQLAAIFWQVAAYRPLENPEITQRFNDLGWMMFLISVPVVTIQGVAISLSIFGDKREEPILPRWFAWMNLWAQLVFLPGTVIPYFKDGPLAWNGIISFWVPAIIYTIWMLTLTKLLLNAVNRQRAEELAEQQFPTPTTDHTWEIQQLRSELSALRADHDLLAGQEPLRRTPV
jgi:hypothetical protein